MSRESNLVKEITHQTQHGELQWSNVLPSRYAEYIFQSPMAYQAFEAAFRKNGHEYQLILVHKKVPSYNTDFDVTEERHATELLVLLASRLISTITDYEVEDRQIGELAEAVDQTNKDVSDLYA